MAEHCLRLHFIQTRIFYQTILHERQKCYLTSAKVNTGLLSSDALFKEHRLPPNRYCIYEIFVPSQTRQSLSKAIVETKGSIGSQG